MLYPLLAKKIAGYLNPQMRCGMLYFHRVLEKPDPLFPDDLTLQQFERLLRCLRLFFDLKTPDDWHAGLLSRNKPSLMISFDDGYRDNLLAAQLLEKYQARGTFFVSTAAIAAGGSANSLWQNKVLAHYRYLLKSLPDSMQHEVVTQCFQTLKRLKHQAPEKIQESVSSMHGGDFSGLDMVNATDIRTLAKAGHCVGLHTHSHYILSTLSNQQAENELARSLDIGRNTLPGQARFFMAYPNGMPGADFSGRHMQIAHAIGFAGAFSTADGGFQMNSHDTSLYARFALPRFLPHRRGALLRAVASCKISAESGWESLIPAREDGSPSDNGKCYSFVQEQS